MLSKKFVILTILFQLGIIAGMLALSMYPLIVGQEIQLETRPRDPRDIFRGQYVALNYDFNTLKVKNLPNDLDTITTYRFGDKLYLELAPKEESHKVIGVWTKRPAKDKLFMEVIVQYEYRKKRSYSLRVKGGIESYYTDPVLAKKLETDVSWRNIDSIQTIVKVMLAPDGKARIKELAQTLRPADSE